MQRRWLAAISVILAIGCGDERPPARSEVAALLQRIDAMEQRLDVLEDAAAKEPEPKTTASEVAIPVPPRLPTTAQDPAVAASLQVHVRADGIALDGKDLTAEQAKERFAAIAKERPETRLAVLAEPEVPYERMIEVLDLAREAGLTDIAMSVRVHGTDEESNDTARIPEGVSPSFSP